MATQANSSIGNQIRQALTGNACLSTAELAKAVKADRSRVYGQCRRLMNEGLLSPSLGVQHRIFCVDCRRVVTAALYPTCRDHDLRQFPAAVCEWELVPQANARADAGGAQAVN